MLNALTIDVEDYYQVSAFEKDVARTDWDRYESRVVANTQRVLRSLDEAQTKATFFVLGWVADHHPELVREIHRAGHEIGSHSYWHRLVYEQTPDEFRADLVRSRDVLEQIVGESVTAYRAPSFSITKKSLWALEILCEEGFTCDSSIFPIHHDRYGIPDARAELHQLATPAGSLWEFPAAVMRIAGVNAPVSGGGYFRLYPLPLTIRALRSVNQRRKQPFVFYTHPWEFDPDQPRLRVGSWLSRRRHYLNLSSTERKLRRLLSAFSFGAIRDVIASVLPSAQPTEGLAVAQGRVSATI
jgi:polysaccharide deacetylase family protein (PEP-CTERM system associated)